jgi:outer membrane protein assembly factor BamB
MIRRLLPALVALVAFSGLAASACAASHAADAASPRLQNWTEFGLNPQRSSSTSDATGITAANVAHLRRVTVKLPGTVDSSPVYLHAARIRGRTVPAAFLDTTYGRVIAIDADSGAILWVFTPRGYASWAGTARITVSSPLIDPDGLYIYAAAPDGRIHKILIASGREVRGRDWPARVTREPLHEKLTPSLNIDGPYLIAGTGGYIGDIPPYQGHIVLIDRSSGRVRSVFNALCANRRYIQIPASCPAWGAAVLSRGGVVVEPGGRRILFVTGNGPYNGRTMFGDAVIELTVPGLRVTQVFTPPDTRTLDEEDLDLGSVAPALVGGDRVLIGGKDHRLRLLALTRLDGRRPAPGLFPLGGELQTLSFGGNEQGIFTQPAVLRTGRTFGAVVANTVETGAFTLRGGLLHTDWKTPTAGTSPVVAGGLVYVYNPEAGGIAVYRFGSGRPLAELPGSPGHWNSPIVVDGHIFEPEGDANAHQRSGTLDIFSVRSPARAGGTSAPRS